MLAKQFTSVKPVEHAVFQQRTDYKSDPKSRAVTDIFPISITFTKCRRICHTFAYNITDAYSNYFLAGRYANTEWVAITHALTESFANY